MALVEQLVRHPLSSLAVAADEHDAGAGFDQGGREALTEAARATGDHGHATVEPEAVEGAHRTASSASTTPWPK